MSSLKSFFFQKIEKLLTLAYRKCDVVGICKNWIDTLAHMDSIVGIACNGI